MKSTINMHNKTVANPQPSVQARTCNCMNISKCPWNNKCLSNNALYKANLTLTKENYRNKIYHGISETKFKSRCQTTENLLKTENKYKTDTALSNEIWKLKQQSKSFDIS